MFRPTSFQQKVYRCLQGVPCGRVTTYKLLAEAVGCRSPRAVGQALKNNPFSPEVPCHRVVKSDLSIGGFCGYTDGAEIERKKAMLSAEGVEFCNGRLRNVSAVFRFGSEKQDNG